MKNLIVPLLLGLAAPLALAKLPAPTLDAAAQAKADEAKARTAWQAKVDAFQLCRAQDRTVAHYRKTAASKPAATAAAAPARESPDAAAASAPAAGAAAGNAATPATASAPPATPPAVPVQVSTAAPSGSSGCPDPGPFAYTPPEQKPLEASGAHSPTGTASSPPSTSVPEAATPDKK